MQRGQEGKSSPSKESASKTSGPVGAGIGVTGSEEDLSTPGNLEKIRSILFGSQMREYDARFARVEERMAHEVNELRSELHKRLDALEALLHKEMDAVNERARQEQGSHGEELTQLAAVLDALAKATEKRTQKLEDQQAKSVRELRQQLFDQTNSFDTQLRTNHAELMRLLERELQGLRTGKADRLALANMFADLAGRLGG